MQHPNTKYIYTTKSHILATGEAAVGDYMSDVQVEITGLILMVRRSGVVSRASAVSGLFLHMRKRVTYCYCEYRRKNTTVILRCNSIHASCMIVVRWSESNYVGITPNNIEPPNTKCKYRLTMEIQDLPHRS